MKALLLFICTCSIFEVYSQQYQPEKIHPKAITTYEKAMIFLRDGAIQQAIPLLEKSIQQDNNYVDAYLSLAGAYGELKNYSKAVNYYQLAKTKDSAYFKIYHLPYAINLAGLGKWKEALEVITIFESIPNLSDRSLK
ncbi:MAG: tetratricopeptide repeat protein, partial [Chitinophagaceae bacterium]